MKRIHLLILNDQDSAHSLLQLLQLLSYPLGAELTDPLVPASYHFSSSWDIWVFSFEMKGGNLCRKLPSPEMEA